MNAVVSDILAQSLINLPFVSKATGCVKTVRKTVASGVFSFPVAEKYYLNAVNNCKRTEHYEEFTPDSKESAIVFFEDMSYNSKCQGSRRYINKGMLRLNVWINKKKLGYDVETADLQNWLISEIPQTILNQKGIVTGKVKVAGSFPKGNPYSKYSLKEEAKQYLMHPYDAFSLRIEYTAVSTVCYTESTAIIEEAC